MAIQDNNVESKPVWPAQPVIDASGTFALNPDGTYRRVPLIELKHDDGMGGRIIDVPTDLVPFDAKSPDVNPYTLACKRYICGG